MTPVQWRSLSSVPWMLALCCATMVPVWAAEADSPTGPPLGGLPLRHDAEPSWSGLGLLQILILGAFLLLWIAWLWRRQGPGALGQWRRRGWRGLLAAGEPDGLRVVQSAALTPRASLHVVRWNGQEWLLGCAEGSVTELGRRDAPTAESRIGS